MRFGYSLLLSLALADLPVNCNYKQVLGSWYFHLDTSTFTADLSDPATTCGHGQPGQVRPLELGEKLQFTQESVYSVLLEEPDIVSSEIWGAGTWTM